jgi:hypothetical protein
LSESVTLVTALAADELGRQKPYAAARMTAYRTR